MPFHLSRVSLANLRGVHPDLIAVVKRAIELTEVDFRVIEGLRDAERQAELVASGASWTMKSRHLTGHAVDVAAMIGRDIRWDWPLYHRIAKAFKMAAREIDVAIVWGGDWKRFPDGPHFELDRRIYK